LRASGDVVEPWEVWRPAPWEEVVAERLAGGAAADLAVNEAGPAFAVLEHPLEQVGGGRSRAARCRTGARAAGVLEGGGRGGPRRPTAPRRPAAGAGRGGGGPGPR